MDKDRDELPSYNSLVDEHARHRARRVFRRKVSRVALLALLSYAVYLSFARDPSSTSVRSDLRTTRLQEDYTYCSTLRRKPQDPSGHRDQSLRYVEGRSAVLIKNATIWTGEPAEGASPEDIHSGKAFSWIHGDVLLEHGLIKKIQSSIALTDVAKNTKVFNANGRYVTSGIVDMHSHAGIDPLPSLHGGDDTNELSDNITPYVRSIDGIDPLDHQIQVVKSGGVTTSLVLPGSGNNMGGEAFVIKHAVGKAGGRSELSINDLLADPEKNWRYMKMACGENAKRVTEYGLRNNGGPLSRIGEAWYFRHAFEQAANLIRKQDEWCAAADTHGVENQQEHLPRDLEWESLGAALRGQVLINTHCYTVPDLESFVGYTNEFNFSVRAFHHAHQTYLVPEVLKRAYGDRPPASALFADNMNYKVESYVASEQAGKILHENGLTPVYVSDNPVINAQHVVFEAAKAFRYGLPYHVALAGVTSAPADLLGLGNRMGKVSTGFDADIVVWDSDPLSVGAAPVQVWIDGTAQFEDPVELKKPLAEQVTTLSSIKDRNISYDSKQTEKLIVSGITKVFLQDNDISIKEGETVNMVVIDGQIICIGQCQDHAAAANAQGAVTLALEKGTIAPGLTVFGSDLGLVEIQGEKETHDGKNTPEAFSAAVDGLLLDGKNLMAAHAHGVTKAISAPKFKGVSAGFRTGATHALEKDAVWASNVALHLDLTPSAKQGKTPSLSSAIGDLRVKLTKAMTSDTSIKGNFTEEAYLHRVVHDGYPLVLSVHSADTIAAIIRLKAEIETSVSKSMSTAASLNFILFGGAESHLLAAELAEADIPIVLGPFLPYATTWDQRRSLTGAPLTNGTTIDALLAGGVKSSNIAISVGEAWEARDLDLAAGIAYANSGGRLSEKEALALVSENVYGMLGLEQKKSKGDFVVYEGSPLEITGRVRAVADGRKTVAVWQ